jgi:hypothetical protein
VGQNFLVEPQRGNWHRASFCFNQRRGAYTRPPRGSTASEHERAAHTVIFDIRKRGHTHELGDRRCPEVVCALDDSRRVRGYFIGVFLG